MMSGCYARPSRAANAARIRDMNTFKRFSFLWVAAVVALLAGGCAVPEAAMAPGVVVVQAITDRAITAPQP